MAVATMGAFHPHNDSATMMSSKQQPISRRKRFSLMALVPLRKVSSAVSRRTTPMPTVDTSIQAAHATSSSSAPANGHRKQPSLDRHDTCREARVTMDLGDIRHPANVAEPLPAKSLEGVCPIARAILSDAAMQQRLNIMALQESAQPQPISKHGVPRLPRGSLTSEKLPLLDHALARVALKRSISDAEANDDDEGTRGDKRHLMVKSRASAAPVLSKARGRSPFDDDAGDDDGDAKSSRDSGESSSDSSHSTRATSDRGQHRLAVPGKKSFALPRPSAAVETADDAQSLLPRPSSAPANEAPARPSISRNLFSHAPTASSRYFKGQQQQQQQQPQRPPAVRASTTSPPRSRARAFSKGSKDAQGRSAQSSPSPPTSYRRASMEAKRLSLLALNSLGGHAPQREYISEVAQ